jgi:hypothetical protein
MTLSSGVDQDRHIEAEGLDAAGDLPDLLAAVSAGIGRIGLELVRPAVDYADARGVARQDETAF